MAISHDLAERTRRTILGFAKRWQKAGSGSILRLTEWGAMQKWPDLREAFRGLRWAIAGAVATRMYMPERATGDLDVVIFADDASAAEAALESAGFLRIGVLAIPGTSWRAPSRQEVDVLKVDGSEWRQALERAARNADPDGAPVLTLPDLVLMKLRSGRSQDVADVVRMLGFARDDALSGVRAGIAEQAPELSDDVESMIELGKLEHDASPEG